MKEGAAQLTFFPQFWTELLPKQGRYLLQPNVNSIIFSEEKTLDQVMTIQLFFKSTLHGRCAGAAESEESYFSVLWTERPHEMSWLWLLLPLQTKYKISAFFRALHFSLVVEKSTRSAGIGITEESYLHDCYFSVFSLSCHLKPADCPRHYISFSHLG